MIGTPNTLLSIAAEVGMESPDDINDYDAGKFPHFHIFCLFQLGRFMEPQAHMDNAKILMNLSVHDMLAMTPDQFVMIGYKIPHMDQIFEVDKVI